MGKIKELDSPHSQSITLRILWDTSSYIKCKRLADLWNSLVYSIVWVDLMNEGYMKYFELKVCLIKLDLPQTHLEFSSFW